MLSAAIRRDELENELRRRTMHDPLTGLPNRVLARQRSEDVRTHGNSCAITVLVIDLDNFKMINDTKGHAVGDRALQAVAHVLAGAAAEGDTVSRFGGNEFVVLHRGPNPEELARGILRDLDAPFNIDGYGITVSASIGVAVDEQFTADPDDLLLRRADIAMYTAKNRGTGFAVYGEPELARSGLGRHVQYDLEFEQ
ncbi:MAG: GGDEF domain-containing protein [Rhodococcus sp. (in: high G+C Gram-positive bacteria)]